MNRGFTLIELVSVIAIIIILVSIAIPIFRQIKATYRLNATASIIYADLMFAKAKAIEESKDCGVKFCDSKTYVIFADNNNNGSYDSDEKIKEVKLDELGYKKISILSTPTIIFNKYGLGKGLANTTIDIKDDIFGKTKKITISKLGRVKVK